MKTLVQDWLDWYNSLDYWAKRRVNNDLGLLATLAIIPCLFYGAYLSVYGLPGQYRGAYRWAENQETPTLITHCQSLDFNVKRCGFKTKEGNWGYVESDNNSEWENFLND